MAVTAEEAESLVLRRKAGQNVADGWIYAALWVWCRLHTARFEARVIGTITGFSVEDGYPFDWQPAGAEFRLDKAGGGGVCLDVGCHVLDMILFWFGGATIVSAMHKFFWRN